MDGADGPEFRGYPNAVVHEDGKGGWVLYADPGCGEVVGFFPDHNDAEAARVLFGMASVRTSVAFVTNYAPSAEEKAEMERLLKDAGTGRLMVLSDGIEVRDDPSFRFDPAFRAVAPPADPEQVARCQAVLDRWQAERERYERFADSLVADSLVADSLVADSLVAGGPFRTGNTPLVDVTTPEGLAESERLTRAGVTHAVTAPAADAPHVREGKS